MDMVFINHGHQDHYGNMELFTNAEVLISIHLARKGSIESKGVKNRSTIADGVHLIYISGYTFEQPPYYCKLKK